MDYKDVLQMMYEEFIECNGREPTLNEYNDFWAEHCSRVINSMETD